MKVICIDDREDLDAFEGPKVVIGEIYTVVREATARGMSGARHQCYVLKEIGWPWAYSPKLFAHYQILMKWNW